MKIAIASSNRGKLAELRQLLAPLGFDLLSQGDLNIASAPETAQTFIENSLEKARHVCRQSGLPAIADDSGIVVDALNGAPGILSARFAGNGASDADNNAKLVAALAGADSTDAHFYCALVYLRTPSDPAPLVSIARWHGRIVSTPRGDGGFGYDPHFYIDELGRTAAELTASEKAQHSHRGKAMRKLCKQLEQAR